MPIIPREADHMVTIVVTERIAAGAVVYRSVTIDSTSGYTFSGNSLEITRRRSAWDMVGTS